MKTGQSVIILKWFTDTCWSVDYRRIKKMSSKILWFFFHIISWNLLSLLLKEWPKLPQIKLHDWEVDVDFFLVIDTTGNQFSHLNILWNQTEIERTFTRTSDFHNEIDKYWSLQITMKAFSYIQLHCKWKLSANLVCNSQKTWWMHPMKGNVRVHVSL